MNCVFHAEVPNTAFCSRCGRALCAECSRPIRNSVYCEECLANFVKGAETATDSPPAKKTELIGGDNPGAAFALGLIPGVGAIYNGEYFKAAVHIVVFGLLMEIAGTPMRLGGPLFGLLAFGFYAYMPFEAYYTAKKKKLRQAGVELETPFDRFNQELGGLKNRDLWGGVVLVALGSIFLLDNFGILQMGSIFKMWPVILIVIGVWLLNEFMKREV